MSSFERWLNLKWIAIAIACATLLIIGTYFYGQQSAAYAAAERWARDSVIVNSRIGTVTHSRLAEYDEDVFRKTASIWIELEGPKGKSTIHVYLEQKGGEWIVVGNSFE